MKRKIFNNIYLLYSILFLLIVFVVFIVFWIEDRSFVSQYDALAQHYVAIVKLKEMILEVLKSPSSFFHFWDWSLGIGGDPYQIFSYYSLGDVFIYLFLFFKNPETTFLLMMLTKLFLSGIAVILFLKNKRKYSKTALLSSGIFYAFCGYAIFSVTTHPMFLTPMVLFPLILLSIDHFVSGSTKGKVAFSLMVAWTLINNFYFAFLIGIGAIFYFLLITFAQKKPIGQKVFDLVKIIPYGLLGIGLSAIIFLPTVYYFLHSTRADVPFSNGMFFFPVRYYLDFFKKIISSPMDRSFEFHGGYAAIVVPAVSLSFYHFKKNKLLNISFIVGFFCLMFPYLSAMINGFASPSTRWAFLLAVPLAMAIANFVENIHCLTLKDIRIIILSSLVFGFFALTGAELIIYKNEAVMFPLIVLFTTVLFILARQLNMITIKTLRYLILGGIILNVSFIGNFYYSVYGVNYVAVHIRNNKVKQQYEESLSKLDREIDDQSFYRLGYTRGAGVDRLNMAPMLGLQMINSYYSLQNESLGNFSNAIGNANSVLAEPLKSLDNRTVANNYLGVKYLIADKSEFIPFGYTKMASSEIEDDNRAIYKTDLTFPFMYTLEQTVSAEDLSKNGVEVEALLSKAIVVDQSASTPTTSISSLGTSTSELPIQIEKNDNKYIITVDKKAKDGLIAGEYYSDVSGISITDTTFRERYETFMSRDDLSRRKKIDFVLGQLDFYTTGTTIDVSVGNKKVTSYHEYSPENISSYNPKSELTFNLGYLGEDELNNQIILTVESNRNVDISSLKLYQKEIGQEYVNEVKKIQSQAVQEMSIEGSLVKGVIDNDNDTTLATSIPYSEGWQLYVNGEKQDILNVNNGFVGADLKKGKQHIKLEYSTPLLKTGTLVTMISAVIFFGMIIIEWLKNRRAQLTADRVQ